MILSTFLSFIWDIRFKAPKKWIDKVDAFNKKAGL